jgi:CMP-N-acetylneuraminic acid synthetase
VRRQEYTGKYYYINGAVYAFTPAFLKNEKLFARSGNLTALYEMPSYRGIDIDTIEDLYRAEAYLAHPHLKS